MVFTRGILFLLLVGAPAAFAQADGDCDTWPCAQVLPGAVRFEAAADGPWFVGYDGADQVLGWVIHSTKATSQKGYSGKPLETLIALDTSGKIAGAHILAHSEPILLVGIPEQKLFDFAAFYTGKAASTRVVVGSSDSPDAVVVDSISGATVTALAQNRTIMESARALAQATGLMDARQFTSGSFVNSDEVLSWTQMERNGILGRLTVSPADVGLKDDQPFMDMFFAVADAPQVGRALLAEGDYTWLMEQLVEGEHLLVIFGRGSSSFKGSGFVRGGLFDRIRLNQGLRSMFFRDVDYKQLNQPVAEDAPEFKEGGVFIVRENMLDPGLSFELVFLASHYDGKGGFSRTFKEFRARHRLPPSIYHLEGPDPEAPLWHQAWRNNGTSAWLVCLAFLGVTGLFVARNWLTASLKRLQALHVSVMLVAFLGLGLGLGAQPSVTQVLTFVGGLGGKMEWGLFLSEPVLFISWIAIAVMIVLWGRGVFCGWLCPFGALTELLHLAALRLGLKPFEFSDKIHLPLRYLRYLILFLLVATFLYSPPLGEHLAEVEPFKTTFFVAPWSRSPLYLTWWLFLLAASVVMFRPFCRYICPLGAALALPSSFRLSGPKRRDFCTKCKICTKGCEPRAIGPDGRIDPRECLSCMECEANYNDEQVCPPLIRAAKGKEQFKSMAV